MLAMAENAPPRPPCAPAAGSIAGDEDMMPPRRLGIALAVVAAAVAATSVTASAGTRTLQEALTLAYTSNPALLAERANVRATDENVPAALAGWHPQVSISGNAGYADGTSIIHTPGGSNFGRPFPSSTKATNGLRGTNTEQLTVTQPLYRGGQTVAGTNKAENQVIGERARLIAQEEATFGAVVTAYINVILAGQVLALHVNNEQVLTRQLQATNDRFRVGEITRTDVAQAEAALAGATATRQTAEGSLQTARSAYQQAVGEFPDKLVEPQPLRLPAKTLDEAKLLASNNNPSVVAALFDDAAAKDNFDLQYSKLMPNLSLQGLLARAEDAAQQNITTKTAQIVMALTMPIYQGGIEYAAIRQARQQQLQTRSKIDDARRAAVQQAISAWETFAAAKSSVESTRQQIRADQIALEGVQREAIVGSRTTLDVLNAEQELLNSRTTLVQSLANLVNASYVMAAAIGRLTARDLGLQVPLYDDTAYYKAVRNKWFGTGDYATDQPAR
jgi:outer membrane protein